MNQLTSQVNTKSIQDKKKIRKNVNCLHSQHSALTLHFSSVHTQPYLCMSYFLMKIL